MWRTPDGDRVLRKTEARLFQKGLASLVAWFDVDDQWSVGVEVFDKLSHAEKLASLENVASALLEEGIAAPKHTAVGEGAIAAVYAQIMGAIDVEIDEGEGAKEVRELVLHTAVECELGEFAPPVSSKNDRKWKDLIEELLDRILWDRDWMEEFVKPDDSPKVAEEIRRFARIDPDYYSAVPPDPNPAQLRRIVQNLERLTTMKV